MHKVVVSEMVHSSREVAENKDPLVLIQAKVVLGIIQEVKEGATGAELHDDDLASPFLLLLNSQQFDNVLVFDFLQDFKLSHLNLLRTHVRQLVERLDRHGLAIVLVDPLREEV